MQDHVTAIIPRHFTLPAKFYNNTPFVPAVLNGKPVTFLFDSGAQEMTLNSRYVNEEGEISDLKVHGASGGPISYFHAPVKSLKFGELEYLGGTLLAIDMKHLEEDFGLEFHGLIGFRQLIHFDWMVDYQAGIVTFWDRVPRKELKIREKIIVRYRHHMPMVEVKINGHKFNLLLDTGAPEVFFDQEKKHLIAEVLSDLKPAKTVTASPEQEDIEKGILNAFQVGNLDFGPSEIWLADISGIKRRMGEMDGVIGYAILSQYRTVVNWSNWSLLFLED